MGTTYTVKVAGAPAGIDASSLRVTIDEVLARIDVEMSGYRPDSQISRFNASDSTDWQLVSTDVARVVTIAEEVSALSGGAFDVTVAPLVNAWGFGAPGEPASLPDAGQLAGLRTTVGHGRLHARLDPPALRKEDARLAIDLNGIAPGFAVDEIAQRLAAAGVQNFMIELGGEVRARGRNGRGESWRVAVEQPIDLEQLPFAVLQLGDAAVATSGEYRHAYVRDGHRYSHTIDPATARPIEHEMGSVVVVAGEAAYADAWATALNVLGPERGYVLASERGIAAMFVLKQGGTWTARMTPGFGKYVAWKMET